MAAARMRWWGVTFLLAAACSDGDAARATGDATTVTMDAGDDVSPGAAMDARTPLDANHAPPSALECIPGVFRVDVCEQPYPGCTTGGGYARAACLADGTLGPCMCVPDPVPQEPPSAEDTATCLPVASSLFVDACAACVCSQSEACAQGLAACDGACTLLTQCLASCVPDGAADLDCILKCIDAYPPQTLARFGMAVPECLARCPDDCTLDLLFTTPDPDADGGIP